MKIFIVLAFAFALAVLMGLIFVPVASASSTVDILAGAGGGQRKTVIIPNEYIVILKPEVVGELPSGDQGLSNSSLKKQDQEILIEANRIDEQLEDQGGDVVRIYNRVFNGFSVKGVDDLTPLVQDPAVQTIQPNWKDFPEKQYLPAGIDRLDLDRALTASSRPDSREQKPNIDIAVIDEPVSALHPDLYVINRVNFVDSCGSVMTCDVEGGDHGTHVAGSVAARDNLGGVVGGLPGARITGLAVCGTGVNDGCQGDAILAAWNYLITNAATIEIATMSIGGSQVVTAAEETAGQNVINAGVTFFVSAGNDFAETVNDHYCGVNAFICVSALSDTDGKCGGVGPLGPTFGGQQAQDDRKAPFSNWGSDVDVMAPGVNILSTIPGKFTSTSVQEATANFPYIGASEQGKYAYSSGTSMATPIAAGIGALIKSKNPSFTPAQIKSTMQADAYPQNQQCDGFGKGGLVQDNSPSSEELIYAGNY